MEEEQIIDSEIVIVNEEINEQDNNIDNNNNNNNNNKENNSSSDKEDKITQEKDKYSNSMTTDVSETKLFIFPKINFLISQYHFNQSYTNSILLIFTKISDLLYKKLTNTLNQNKNILKFFKEITCAYQRFSTDLIKANLELTDDKTKDQIFSVNINNTIEQTQEIISNNFLGFSNVLQNNIILKGPFAKMNEFFKRLETISKDIRNNLDKIQKKKEKLNKIYTLKYSPIFDQFKKLFNDNDALNDNIFYKYDFFVIELDLISNFNSISESVKEFLIIFKKHIMDVKTLISDYLNLVKETMEIYINENKKIFAGNMNINLETIHNFYESITKESLEINLSVGNILREEENIKLFNELLLKYQSVLLKFNKGQNEDFIYNGEKFLIGNYKLMDDFILLFEKSTPDQIDFKNSFLIDRKFELKRDPGIFKSWKSTVIAITKQNNVLVFDEDISFGKYLNFVNLKKLKFKTREEKKYPYRFEIFENKKGFLFDSKIDFILDAGTKEKYEDFTQLFIENHNNNYLHTDEPINTTRII